MICAATWNVRGLNGVAHQRAVGQLVGEFNIKFLGLLETRVRVTNAPLVQNTLFLLGVWFVDYTETGSRIWLAWCDDEVQGLIQLSRGITDEPWIVMGDFNAVLDDSEVNGDGERSLWKRLDRMLVNEAWLVQWPQSKYISSYPRTSDHSPLILQGQDNQVNNFMFRFDNYMTKMAGFLRLVEEHWGQQIAGTDMYILARKLKAMKPILRKFRKTHGDLTHNVQQAAHFLHKAQLLSHEFKHVSILLQLEKCCRMIYCKATTMEVNMLKQRAKIAWLKGGEFVNYFKKLFGGSQRHSQNLDHLQPFARYLISENEATQISAPVQRSEIKEALFDINEDSAPGPDGFSSGFFKATWTVTGEDVCRAVMEFFNNGSLLKQLNTTLITLIPKVQLPTKVGDFRPISCCNVVYKIITKIMVKRMQLVLEKLVDNCRMHLFQGEVYRIISSSLKNYYQAIIRKSYLPDAPSRLIYRKHMIWLTGTISWLF
ncbi:UNVERIFIED_CONTAM: hypothetical protein Scaly_2581800 [Sesamum calycinum]|uniref:Endonuclease/exonuclease/phosphatase domain-containing protein n=1 Tax=Sesamum calycinum TaxID=2727403 RepID=A0AAW2JEI0_9LAMI